MATLNEWFSGHVHRVLDRWIPIEHHWKTVGCTAISSNGRWGATCGFEGTVKVLELSTGKRTWRFFKSQEVFRTVYFDKNDAELVAVSCYGRIFRLDAETGRRLDTIHLGYELGAAIPLPDTKRLIISNNEAMFIWDLGENRRIQEFAGATDRPCMVQFAPQANLVAAVSHQPNKVFVWSIGNPDPIAVFQCQLAPFVMGIDPAGRWILFREVTRSLSRWSLPEKKALGSPKDIRDPVLGIAVRQDGKFAAVGYHGGGVGVFEVETGTEVFRGDKPEGAVGALCFSPDGKQILAGCVDGTVAIVKVLY